MVPIQTHRNIDPELCGVPRSLEDGACRVEMMTTDRMAVDESGLVHGGFVFGLADHAAMVAVNHPNVVLGAAEVRFLRPVRPGERLTASARVESRAGKKHVVRATVHRNEEAVLEGSFTCFVLEKHVLAEG